MSISDTASHKDPNGFCNYLLSSLETMPDFRDDNYLAGIEVFFEPRCNFFCRPVGILIFTSPENKKWCTNAAKCSRILFWLCIRKDLFETVGCIKRKNSLRIECFVPLNHFSFRQ